MSDETELVALFQRSTLVIRYQKGVAMTNDERKALLARIARATKAAKSMSREEARKQLVAKGFYTDDGHLTAQYGGKVAAGG